MEELTVSALSVRERMWNLFEKYSERPHALALLALVAFTDAIASPLVPEIFIAVLVAAHPSRWKQYLSVSIVATVLGATVGYIIAGFLFQQFGQPILAFYHLEPAFMTAQHFIRGHVFLAMMVVSFTPIPDKVFIYAGGFLGAHFTPFITGYVIGRGARMALVAFLAERYGKQALELLSRYLLWVGAVLLALLSFYATLHWHLFPW